MGRYILALGIAALVVLVSNPGSAAAFSQLETLEVETQQAGQTVVVTELQENENTIIVENGSAKVLSYGVGSRKF